MTPPNPRKKSIYTNSSVQVLFAVAAAVALGCLRPATAIALKPLGTLSSADHDDPHAGHLLYRGDGHRRNGDLKKVGRVGGKALLYFEVVSTLALFIGLVVGNVLHPGSGFNITRPHWTLGRWPNTRTGESANCFGIPDAHRPNTVVDAFSKGDILQVLLVSVLFGFALSAAGPRCKPLLDFLNMLTDVVFGIVTILMRLAPFEHLGRWHSRSANTASHRWGR